MPPIDMGAANKVFTPGAPIQSNDLFQGRQQQIQRILEAVPAPGVHPIVFGQRGVGKTSLANIVKDVLANALVVKVSCDGADNFASIWDKVLSQATVSFKKKALGFSDEQVTTIVTLNQFLPERENKAVRVADIAGLLGRGNESAIYILDEFDRVRDEETLTRIADLIKLVSDTLPNVTIVIVGVGGSVKELMGEHPSIGRNLRQIEMPKMSPDEIKAILRKGFQTLGIQYEEWLLDEIVQLADGFPHYAHLLGLAVARALNAAETTAVTRPVFDVACNLAVEDAIETLRDAFSLATASSRPSAYPRLLMACGHAKTDERGVFRATAVVEAASELFGGTYTVQAVVPALGAFSSDERGNILQTVRVAGRTQYRFKEPMMRPFLRIKCKAVVKM